VNALHDQGYTFQKDVDGSGVWSADCKFDPKYCALDVGLDPTGKRVEVTFYPGG
jgi:hypothetical protein